MKEKGFLEKSFSTKRWYKNKAIILKNSLSSWIIFIYIYFIVGYNVLLFVLNIWVLVKIFEYNVLSVLLQTVARSVNTSQHTLETRKSKALIITPGIFYYSKNFNKKYLTSILFLIKMWCLKFCFDLWLISSYIEGSSILYNIQNIIQTFIKPTPIYILWWDAPFHCRIKINKPLNWLIQQSTLKITLV